MTDEQGGPLWEMTTRVNESAGNDLFVKRWTRPGEVGNSWSGYTECLLERLNNGRLALTFEDLNEAVSVTLEPEDMVLTLEALLEAARSALAHVNAPAVAKDALYTNRYRCSAGHTWGVRVSVTMDMSNGGSSVSVPVSFPEPCPHCDRKSAQVTVGEYYLPLTEQQPQ